MLKQLFCKHVYYFVADVQRTPAKYRNEEIIFSKGKSEEVKETKHYITIRCKKCYKERNLTPFIRSE